MPGVELGELQSLHPHLSTILARANTMQQHALPSTGKVSQVV
jgi:hypothetical protein